MSIEFALWMFLIYSFLGWCVEVIYGTVTTGKFINRGFLGGPVCPIYGLGMLIILTITDPYQDNAGLLFLVSMLLASLLELVIGAVLHRLFNQRWWNYSQNPLNIGGYICLKFSLIWGLGCVLVVKTIHPLIEGLINNMTVNSVWLVVLIVALMILLIDIIATVNRMLKIRQKLLLVDDIDQQIKQLSNKIGVRLHLASKKTMNELERRLQERDQLLNWLTRQASRLAKSFPDSNLAKTLTKMNTGSKTVKHKK